MYHHAISGQVCCVRCKKPMSKWRAGDECTGDTRGHVGPSMIPSNFEDEGFWYECDHCHYREETIDNSEPRKFCPECTTGIMHLQDLLLNEKSKSSADLDQILDTEAFES